MTMADIRKFEEQVKKELDEVIDLISKAAGLSLILSLRFKGSLQKIKDDFVPQLVCKERNYLVWIVVQPSCCCVCSKERAVP